MKICPRCAELFPDDAAFCPHDASRLEISHDRFLGRTIAARYRLIRKLGHGGMSVVYLARHELIDRLSAIKILRPELSSLTEHRERFLREARAVNRINHENIVEISDVGESDGIAYLVMEYVEGESLLAWIQRGRVPWDRACLVGMQVAGALARAHQTGVIHRDLKPENILLTAKDTAGRAESSPQLENGGLVVKLTDFGIAKVMSEPSLTLNEQLFGTPGYIAPEYVAGLGIDGRADIYSLAVVLYELVTGVLPFDGKGQSELLLKPLTTAPVPPSQRLAGLPPDFEALLLRCLSREPDERPHDAFAVHDALADIVRRYETPSEDRRSSLPPSISMFPAPSVRESPISTELDLTPEMEKARQAILSSLPPETPLQRLIHAPPAEIGERLPPALAALERRLAEARGRGAEHARSATRAAEFALVATEMVPRIERASKVVSDLSAKVDLLEVKGREFRTNLGHAIDVLVHDRSRERAHLETLGAHEHAAEHARVCAVIDDLDFQIDALQKQLDSKNEAFEQEHLIASGALEGWLSALHRLAREVICAIEDAEAILEPSRAAE